jgi:hypothetical protein
MFDWVKRFDKWWTMQTTDVKYVVQTLPIERCPACNDTKKARWACPVWSRVGDAPIEILCMDCPDCVPCHQCANPDCKGVHTCRKFKGGRLLKPEETK